MVIRNCHSSRHDFSTPIFSNFPRAAFSASLHLYYNSETGVNCHGGRCGGMMRSSTKSRLPCKSRRPEKWNARFRHEGHGLEVRPSGKDESLLKSPFFS